ncbi:unnamed protein product [Ostreobium quekettii]|uniref:AAA+ ATPase domain-containing protein n=1 Tax=Ostreobium quekettii TaxID=121088 RepID=A0A8S1J4U5_9CHLO|nr:unnamed protein product [Ostreobium quekettii]
MLKGCPVQEFLRPVGVESADCGEPSTSQSGSPEADQLVQALSTAPLAALSLKDIKKNVKELSDRVYFGSGEYLPIVGTMRMSYGRLIQLLKDKRVKRIFLMADGQVAIVEVPFETHASNYKSDIRYDRRDLSVVYVEQKPEWQMEKMRYYVELPGDIWEDGTFLELIKKNQYHHSADNRVKYEWMLKEHQVTCELTVLDPNNSYVFLNQYVGQILPIMGLIALRGIVGVGDWLISKFGKPKKDAMAELAEQYARPRALEFNVEDEEGNRNDTGVRFEDVAGIDRVKYDVTEVLKMLRGDENYERIGARAPRGILLEGPPGTGKTYLAKAMAGEGGMPFYSANGAEFVEMFSGVAASRIRNLFKMARKKAPSIIFIDEIDAIGKARGSGGDSGSQEREQGLMQLLVEMDGIRPRDKVLVIGATNRINLLDQALLRPGRFDRIIYMGRPSESNRLKILQVHTKDKPLSRMGNEEYETDAILRETASLTLGYSGAELANLLNEAAILSVREANVESLGPPVITMKHVKDSMEKARLGLPQEKLPSSSAKKFLATVLAGRAVALALTPGVPLIESVSILPQGSVIGRILFQRREYGMEGDMWHGLAFPGPKVNAVEVEEPAGTFEFCAGLLCPFYAGRATEEVIFGHSSMTLSTAKEISRAGDLAHYLVAKSNLHPAFRHLAVKLDMRMGGRPDPTLQNTAPWFERHTTQMLNVAYSRAKRLIEQRRPVIKEIAEILCTRDNERVSGAEIVQLLESTPLDKTETTIESVSFEELWGDDLVLSNGNGSRPKVGTGGKGSMVFNGGQGNVGQVWFERPVSLNGSSMPFEVSFGDAQDIADVVIGNMDVLDLLCPDIAEARVEQLKSEVNSVDVVERLKAVKRYRTDIDAPFPPPPSDVEEGRGQLAPDWVEYLREQSTKDPSEMKRDLEAWRRHTAIPQV